MPGRPDDPAVIEGPTGRVVTRAELIAAIKSFAGGLTARGLAPGQTIAVMAPNMPEFIIAFHGAAWAGNTITTVNPAYTAEEVHSQLKDSGAVLSGHPAGAGRDSPERLPKAPRVAEIAVIGEDELCRPDGARRWRRNRPSIRPSMSSPCPIPRAPPACPRG